MKFPLIALLLLLMAFSSLSAEENDYAARRVLSRHQRTQVRELYNQAMANFRMRRFDRVLRVLDELQRIFPDFVDAVSLRGAVFLEQGDFAKAGALFDKALELDPNAFWPKFDQAEILFQQEKYDESKVAFEKLTNRFPFTEQVQFTLVLNDLMLKDEEAAREMLSAMKYPSNTGAYYYAWAAIEFTRGKPDEARSWIETADALFGAERNLFFYDSLADLGWVEKRVPQ